MSIFIKYASFENFDKNVYGFLIFWVSAVLTNTPKNWKNSEGRYLTAEQV